MRITMDTCDYEGLFLECLIPECLKSIIITASVCNLSKHI